MRILIAEDEVHLAEAVSQILKKITPWTWSTTADRTGLCAERHLRSVTAGHYDAGNGRHYRT